MKSFNFVLLAVLLPMVIFFTGCRNENIRNIENEPVIVTSKGISLEKTTKAIQQAGISRGWSMRLVKPGHIEATLNLRKHMAKVDINYTTKSYSITYKDSAELGYDGTQIHKNYNSWVNNLDISIKQKLGLL